MLAEGVHLTLCPMTDWLILVWQIFLTIPDLPSLREEQSYSCYFEDYESPAALIESGIVCPSPDPSQAPTLQTGTGQ